MLGFGASYIRDLTVHINWGLSVCQKQVSRAGTSNYIPQALLDVIICSCLWCLLLAPKSSIDTVSFRCQIDTDSHDIAVWAYIWIMAEMYRHGKLLGKAGIKSEINLMEIVRIKFTLLCLICGRVYQKRLFRTETSYRSISEIPLCTSSISHIMYHSE